MLKKVPYTSNLISIGNANNYEGKSVYSDGRVAYGWHYTPQQVVPSVLNTSGFWVGEQDSKGYRLANKALFLERKINSSEHGIAQCYPCWASSSTLYTPEEERAYTGLIVAMNSDGNLLTYDKYNLHFDDVSMDISPLRYDYANPIRCVDGLKNENTVKDYIRYNAANTSRECFQISDVNGSYFCVQKRKKDVYGNALSNATFTIHYGENEYANISGEAGSDGVNTYVYSDVEARTYADMYVVDANNDVIARAAGSVVDVYDTTTGDVLYSGQGAIVTQDDIAASHAYTVQCNWAQGVGTLSGSTTNGVIKYGSDDAVEIGGGTITVDGVYTGTGTLSYTDGDYTISCPWMSGTGKALFKKRFTTSFPWDYGTGYIVGSGNDLTVYTNSSMTTKVAESDGQTVTVYDTSGNTIYSGGGYIIGTPGDYQTYNIQATGLYGIGYEYRTSSVRRIYNDAGRVIASYQGGTTTVYDDAGVVLYSGTGTISTTDYQQVEVNGAVYEGYIRIASQGDDAVEVKKYYVDSESVTERAYPETLQVGQGVTLDLSDFSLKIGETEYGNDPLGLSATSGLIYPSGVHSWNDFIISQAGKIIWHAGRSKTYNGIENCFNLAWLRKKWL